MNVEIGLMDFAMDLGVEVGGRWALVFGMGKGFWIVGMRMRVFWMMWVFCFGEVLEILLGMDLMGLEDFLRFG